jgi:hypothetical protein
MAVYSKSFAGGASQSLAAGHLDGTKTCGTAIYVQELETMGTVTPLNDSETICTVVGTVLHGGTCPASIAVLFFQAASLSNKQRRCSIWPHRFFMHFATFLAPSLLYTAKTQYRKFETNIPSKGISRSQFPHS